MLLGFKCRNFSLTCLSNHFRMKHRKPTYTLVMNFYVVLRIILSVFLLYIMYTKISFDWKTFAHFTRDRKRIPSIGRVSYSVFYFMISSLNTFLTFKFYLLEQQCINECLMQSYYCLLDRKSTRLNSSHAQ